MKALDFIYDGVRLSDLGYMICTYDPGSGISVADSGCQIDFETVVSRQSGATMVTNTNYGECLEATFCICKNIDDQSQAEISVSEMRTLVSWLNRHSFKELRFVDNEWDGIYFNAIFNIARCELYGVLVGLELTMMADKPYATGDPVVVSKTVSSAGGSAVFTNLSDEVGFTYPTSVEIICNGSGELDLYHNEDRRHTVIQNCSNGETITMSPFWQTISTSNSAHKIQNDFNFNFLRLTRTFSNNNNTITASLPCKITITYSPCVKAFL